MSKKKRMGKGSGQSKGERKNVSLANRVHRDERIGSQFDRKINQMKAYAEGKRTMVTVENPDKSAKNARFIKVEGNSLWGDWRGRDFDKKKAEK